MDSTKPRPRRAWEVGFMGGTSTTSLDRGAPYRRCGGQPLRDPRLPRQPARPDHLERAALLPGAGRRRVPELRPAEVAVLAGVSTDWYARLEEGHIAGVSDDLLEAVARMPQLDEAERSYLFDLTRAAKPTRAPQRRSMARGHPRWSGRRTR